MLSPVGCFLAIIIYLSISSLPFFLSMMFWEHSFEIWIHDVIIASHNSSRLVDGTSRIQIFTSHSRCALWNWGLVTVEMNLTKKFHCYVPQTKFTTNFVCNFCIQMITVQKRNLLYTSDKNIIKSLISLPYQSSSMKLV